MIETFDTGKILKRALKNGGDFAEIYEEYSLQTQVAREMKRFERLQKIQDAGVGLRVLYDGKTAYASTTEITEKSLLLLADALAEAIRGKHFEKVFQLKPSQAHWSQALKLDPKDFSLQDKAQIVLAADEVAWAHSAHIQQVTAVYRDQFKELHIINSLGEYAHEKQNYVMFVTQVVAAKNDIIQTGYEPLGGTLGMEMFANDAVIHAANAAAQRAVMLLDAPLAPSGTMPVVLSSDAGGTMVHEAVGHGLEADLAREGLSVYQDKLGSRVGSELITVIDDPTIPGKRGSFLFDDEGTPAQKNVLIKDGILQNYMYNRLYGMKDGVPSTGNGRRESFRFKPIVRMTNTMIAPGQHDPQDIIASVDKGLFVKHMGGGQVNTVNGDFVFEITEGYMLKNGKIDHPIRGATLAGNGPQVLQSIDMIGKDLGFSLGTCGKDGQGVPVGDAQPTLRIPMITVGGQ